MSLVDFHCHLDLYDDFANMVDECEEKQIHTLTVTTTPYAWPKNCELTKNKKYVRAALGLHPQLVHERPNDFQVWKKYLLETRYIGEVGLDSGPRFYKSLEQQKFIFQEVLRLSAEVGKKILTVHSVRSVPTVLNMIEEHIAGSSCRVVLHWFTGSISDARRAIDLGCYFSVNAEMSKTQRHIDLLNIFPIDRILTETDGPFTQQGSKPTRPGDVVHAVKKIASVRNLDQAELTSKILSNLRSLEED